MESKTKILFINKNKNHHSVHLTSYINSFGRNWTVKQLAKGDFHEMFSDRYPWACGGLHGGGLIAPVSLFLAFKIKIFSIDYPGRFVTGEKMGRVKDREG